MKSIADYQDKQKKQSTVEWKNVKTNTFYDNDSIEGVAYLGDVKVKISIYQYDEGRKKKFYVWIDCKFFEIEWKKKFNSFKAAQEFFEEVFTLANQVREDK
jgi:hypothetical protein